MAADKPVRCLLNRAAHVPAGRLLADQGHRIGGLASIRVDQAGGRGVPKGPAAILVHLPAPTFNSPPKPKKLLADNGEVMDEVRRAMLEMGRGLRKHLEKKKKMVKVQEKLNWSTTSFQPLRKSRRPSSSDLSPIWPVPSPRSWAPSSPKAPPTGTRSPRHGREHHPVQLHFSSEAYTLLASWPEREGATMEQHHGWTKGSHGRVGVETRHVGTRTNHDHHLRRAALSEATGRRRMSSSQPRGHWGLKDGRKLLEEIRRQEVRASGESSEDGEGGDDAETIASEVEAPKPAEAPADEAPKPSGQQTLMGFGSDA